MSKTNTPGGATAHYKVQDYGGRRYEPCTLGEAEGAWRIRYLLLQRRATEERRKYTKISLKSTAALTSSGLSSAYCRGVPWVSQENRLTNSDQPTKTLSKLTLRFLVIVYPSLGMNGGRYILPSLGRRNRTRILVSRVLVLSRVYYVGPPITLAREAL